MRKVLASKGFVIFLSVSFLEMFFLEARGGDGVTRSCSWPFLRFSERAGVNDRRLLPSHSYPTLDGVCISAIKEVSVIFIFPNEYELDGVLKRVSDLSKTICQHDNFCDILARKMTSEFYGPNDFFYFFYINRKLTCLAICGDKPGGLGVFLGKAKLIFTGLDQVILFGFCGCPNLNIPLGTVVLSTDYRLLHRATGKKEILQGKSAPFLSQANSHFTTKGFERVETSVVLEKIKRILNVHKVPHIPCHNCNVSELLSDCAITKKLAEQLSECVIVNQEDFWCRATFGEKFLSVRFVSDHCGRKGASELKRNRTKALKILSAVALLVILDANKIVAP